MSDEATTPENTLGETLREQIAALQSRLDACTDELAKAQARIRSLETQQQSESPDTSTELRLLWHAFNQSASSIVITDKDGDIQYVNPYFTRLTGYSLDEVVGKNPRVLKSGYTSPEEYKHLWDTITTGRKWSGAFQNKKKNGDVYWEQASISPILNEHGEITHFVAIKEDITRRKEAEDALRDSEIRFRTLVNSMDDIVFTLDPEGRHTGVYGRWLETYGTSPEMFLGKTPAEVLGGDNAEIHEKVNAQVLTGQSVVYEWQSGEQTFHTSLSPLRHNDGKVVGMVGIGRDISYLKAVEQQFRESERFAHATVDALSAHIAILDEHGTILAVNKAWQRFAAQNNAAMDRIGVGINYLDVLRAVDPSSDDAPTANAVFQGIQQTIRGDIPSFSVEYPCHSHNKKQWFVVRITRFHGEGPTRVVVAHENITERMMAEIQLADYTAHLEELVEERTAQLQRLNKRLTTVLNNVSTPVLLVDADGKIQIANPSFNNKFGYSPDELVGRSLWSIFDTTHHPVLFNLMHTAQNSGTSKAAQIQIAGKNGACIDAEISLSSVPDNDSQVVCTLYDISHLKEVERVKDEFISMVTHELRTPVTSIVLSLSMMDIYYDRLTDEQKRSKLDNVCNQANTLAELVKSILDVSRFADRRGKRRDDPVDVGKTLREVAVELNEQVAAKRQQLHLDIFNDAVDDALNGASNDSANSRLTIRGEAIDIMRVWRNLLTNAIKYTEEGGSITARALAADRLPDLTAFGDSIPVDLCSGDYIIGLVEDNGHGIRSEDMPHLFSRFYRGWAAGTNITGTGLGLSLVRDVLRYYGGDIAVSSTLGVGTTFCFWLLADRTL